MGRTFLAKDSQYNWSTTLDRLSDDPLRILTQIERELSNADRKYEIVPRNWRANEPSLADARHFASFMDSKSYAPAATLASIDLNVSFGTKKLLDIGGGSGRYALEISKRQEIECVMLELPVMAEAAKQYCQGMIEVISGDVFERIPEGYDTHLLCDTVHMFEQPDALIILQNCFKALPKGGTILLSNAMLDDSGITPRNSVYFYLSMFVSGAGQAYYPAQFREVLEKAGFINVAFLPYHAHYMLVSARKP